MPEACASDIHIHGVFKRPQIRQCRDGLVRAIARTPPPAFLFPNQRCQRPDWLSPTPPFNARRRRRRLSSRPGSPCQSTPFRFFCAAEQVRLRRKKPLWAAEGLPSQSIAIRLKSGNLCSSEREIKDQSASFHPRKAPPDRGAALLVAPPSCVNRRVGKLRRQMRRKLGGGA